MSSRLQKLISLARRTGDRLIVHNPLEDSDIVIMDLDEYAALVDSSYDWEDDEDIDPQFNGEDDQVLARADHVAQEEEEVFAPNYSETQQWHHIADVLHQPSFPDDDQYIPPRHSASEWLLEEGEEMTEEEEEEIEDSSEELEELRYEVPIEEPATDEAWAAHNMNRFSSPDLEKNMDPRPVPQKEKQSDEYIFPEEDDQSPESVFLEEPI